MSILNCIGNKRKPLPSGSWTTIARGDNITGIIKKVWLALSAVDASKSYFRIFIDGNATPQVGTLTSSNFTLGNSIAVDVLFTAGFGAQSYWANEISGCNMNTSGAMGGYVGFHMPFNTSFEIQIFNNSSSGEYWSQVLYEELSDYQEHYFYLKPFLFLNPSNTVSSFLECPLLSVSSPRGVSLFTVKTFIASNEIDGWQEGKIRMYEGGFGMTGTKSYEAFSPSDISYYGSLAGVTKFFESTGTEDFFLSSHNFKGLPLFNNCKAGVLYNNNGQLGNLTCYRNFLSQEMPTTEANKNMVVTWTCGDQNTPIASSLQFIAGYVGYYA